MLHSMVYKSLIRLQKSLEKAENELQDKFFSTCNLVQNTIIFCILQSDSSSQITERPCPMHVTRKVAQNTGPSFSRVLVSSPDPLTHARGSGDETKSQDTQGCVCCVNEHSKGRNQKYKT